MAYVDIFAPQQGKSAAVTESARAYRFKLEGTVSTENMLVTWRLTFWLLIAPSPVHIVSKCILHSVSCKKYLDHSTYIASYTRSPCFSRLRSSSRARRRSPRTSSRTARHCWITLQHALWDGSLVFSGVLGSVEGVLGIGMYYIDDLSNLSIWITLMDYY